MNRGQDSTRWRAGGRRGQKGQEGQEGQEGQVTVGCPSGQREQTVNLPADAYEGSNPSPTIR